MPHVAVFDTAFHATIPQVASTYAIPLAWRDWGVRRYGFHGIAVQSVVSQLDAARIVACHLGGGCSVTAVLNGRSIDTTMGFTPLEGVPMATRSGSVDPGALIYLLHERGLTVDELDAALEHESGLAALGGLDDPLAFAVYTYRIAGAVAHMAMALSGIDVLAFSGGVGENRADVRDAIVERVSFLGEFGTQCGSGQRRPRDRALGAESARDLAQEPGSRPGSRAWGGVRPTGRTAYRRRRTTCSRRP